jgi:hypothetical protein
MDGSAESCMSFEEWYNSTVLKKTRENVLGLSGNEASIFRRKKSRRLAFDLYLEEMPQR